MKMNILATGLLLSASAFAQTSAKGIFLNDGRSNAPRSSAGAPAVEYNVELFRNGERITTAASKRFQDGDKIRLHFRLSKPGFIYLVNHTVKGHPDNLEQYSGSKGVIVVTSEERASYTLLFPRGDMNNQVQPGEYKTVPEGQGSFLELDREPGIEKMVLVVSPTKLNIGKFFSIADGRPRAPQSGGRNDSDADVMGQLTKEIAANATTEDATIDAKGICVGACNSYVAPRESSKPYMLSIDLRHYPVRGER